MNVEIKIDHAVKKYGNNTVIPDLSLDIKPGSFFTLLGPSGCGKTTLLRMIAGFNSIEGGDFYFNDKRINDLDPSKRNIGMVFQNYAIFPHMTVRKNVEFGLQNRKLPRAQITEQASKYLKMMKIEEYAERKPENLSGGQQQRVALARALVVEPGVLLFDEPLSNLDAKLRVQMRTEIRRIQQKLGITAIYVTHDQSEAMSISDQIIIMQKGVIAQIGTPMEIYYHPVNEFVADFIGEANFLKGTVADSTPTETHVTIGNATVVVASDKDAVRGQECEIVLRPEAIQLGDAGMLPGKVELSCFMGSYQNYHVRVGDTLVKIADNCPVAKKIYAVGDDVWLSFDKECAHIL